MERRTEEKNPQGLIPALKNSFLLWLLVPLLVPALSFAVYLAAYLTLGPPSKNPAGESVFFNIDLVNSFLIALVVLLFALVAIADKLGWLFFRGRIQAGEPADPATRIRLLRERLAKLARKVRDSSDAEKTFLEKATQKSNKESFALAMGRCLDTVEKLAGRQFRINNFDLWERCTMPSSYERIAIDFSLAGDLLAALQDGLSQFTLRRCTMIQRLYHRPEILDPFQDICNLYESMSDLVGKDSHNATNDNHPEVFTDRYSDTLRVDRLAERYADGVAKAAERLGSGSPARPVQALFVGCGWRSLLFAVFDKLREHGLSVDWTFADIDPSFPGNSTDLPTDNDPERLVRIVAPYFGPYSQFEKWKNQFDVVLYAHCLQHSAQSCKDPVFDALLRCAKPGGTAMLAMASSWDPEFDGCAVEGLATYEAYKLAGADRAPFEHSFGHRGWRTLPFLRRRPREFSWKPTIRGLAQKNYSVRPNGVGVWRVESEHRNEGHVLKTCGRYLFYRHRETGAARNGCQIWSFLANEPVGDAERTAAFVEYAEKKLSALGERGPKTTTVRETDSVFVESGDRAVLVLSANVFRAGTGTTPMKRDTDRFLCLLCSRAERAAIGGVPDPRKDRAGAVAIVKQEFGSTPSEVSIVSGGDRDDAPVFVFVRPENSLDPMGEHLLFVFLPGGVWRSFLPKTCQFPLDLFEKKPAEWLARCAKEFAPFGIRAALDPPTITRRMSHSTRRRIFADAGYPEIDEYYHQILANVPSRWRHEGVPDGILAGRSDVDRDARFNELPLSVRLELLDDLNVQDVLVSGVRAVPRT